tara:strand:- start:773 stop:898 length:126 start_codon:yes stop_codon:yes gene_type:complete
MHTKPRWKVGMFLNSMNSIDTMGDNNITQAGVTPVGAQNYE